MIEYLTSHPGEVVAILLAVLGLFSAIARMTPNTADNKIADWLLKRVNNFGLRGGSDE